MVGQAGLEVTRRDGVASSVLVVRGAIDVAQCRRLSTAIHDVLRSGLQRLVIDLCGVEFVDSTGLAVLVQARRRAIGLGTELKLACDGATTLKVLALTGLDRSFDVYPTREEALQARPTT
jgi:anti-sigma B factor antagonist